MLRGSRQCSHMPVYAALVTSPRALPDGLILVFQNPAKERKFFYHEGHEGLRTKKQFTTKGTKVKSKKSKYYLLSSACSVVNPAPCGLYG